MVTCFRYPFGIAMSWASMLVHGHYLCFDGDAVEELFNVITKCRADIIGELLCVLEEDHVIESEIINRFAFAVGIDVGWEGIRELQSVGHLVAYPASEESLPVMVERDRTTCERITWFGDGDFGVGFGDLW